MFTTVIAGLVLLAAPAPQRSDTTFNVDPRGRLQIEDLHGDLRIRTWDRPQIRVTVDPDDRENLRVDAGAGTVRVGFDRMNGDNSGDLDLTIPASMAIRVAGPNGDVEIDGSQGEVSVETVEGSIHLRGGRSLVSLHTVQGDVSVTDAQGRMDFHTVSGDVDLASLTGDLLVEAISGDIKMDGIDSGNVQASSVSGDLSYDGTIRDRGRYSLTSHSGDVTLVAPGNVDALVSVSTFSGDFDTDIPVQLSELHRGKRFSFTLGSGSARVELESFSGDIRLARTAGH